MKTIVFSQRTPILNHPLNGWYLLSSYIRLYYLTLSFFPSLFHSPCSRVERILPSCIDHRHDGRAIKCFPVTVRLHIRTERKSLKKFNVKIYLYDSVFGFSINKLEQIDTIDSYDINIVKVKWIKIGTNKNDSLQMSIKG